MSDKSNDKSIKQPEPKRRESDLTGHDRGNHEGGRRKSDAARALPRSNVAKIAIACSFLFSTGLIAWAFTLPFRSGEIVEDGLRTDLPKAKLANLEYEARLSAGAYVDYTRDMDRRLLNRVQDKYRTNDASQSKREAYRKWEQGVEKRKKQLEQMQEDLGGEVFEKGTIEWQNRKDLEKIMNDAPEEA